jgi:hypothetical protein
MTIKSLNITTKIQNVHDINYLRCLLLDGPSVASPWSALDAKARAPAAASTKSIGITGTAAQPTHLTING